jgi:hypothetical protein
VRQPERQFGGGVPAGSERASARAYAKRMAGYAIVLTMNI